MWDKERVQGLIESFKRAWYSIARINAPPGARALAFEGNWSQAEHPGWRLAGSHLPPYDRSIAAESALFNFDPHAPLLEDDSLFRALYEAFDVSQPVRDAQGLVGREEQLQRLIDGVLYRRNHGIISGPRGSGKTSMVKIFGNRADAEGVVVVYGACDPNANFGLMMRAYVDQIPPASLQAGDWEVFQERVRALNASSTPQEVNSVLSRITYSSVVIIIDEFDRVRDRSFRSQVSSLLKLASDGRIPVRFILVGDRLTFADVVQNHASMTRHVTHVWTNPLSKDAMLELLSRCAEAAEVEMAKDAQALIAQAACGSPYHARLFGLHAALDAISSGTDKVKPKHVMAGFANAFDEWASLNPHDAELFRNHVRGTRKDRALVNLAQRLAREQAINDDEDIVESVARTDAGMQFIRALQRNGKELSFEDATAPQYLIALHLTQSRQFHSDEEAKAHA